MMANHHEGSYVNFAITQGDGTPITCSANPCTGYRLTTSADLPSSPNPDVYVRKAFGIYKGSANTYQSSGACAPSATESCHLDLVQAGTGWGPDNHKLTSDDINVLNIEFSGYDWTNTNLDPSCSGNRCIAPYITIRLHTQSAYTEAGGAPDLWLKTTVRPFNTNNTGGGGFINEKLVY